MIRICILPCFLKWIPWMLICFSLIIQNLIWDLKKCLQSCGGKGMLRCSSNIVLMLRGDSGSCIFVLHIRFIISGPGLVSKYAFKSGYKLELTGTSRLLISYVFDMIRPPSQEVSQCKHSELLKLTINGKI